MNPNGHLYLIVGPSGVGKGTLVGLLRERHPDFYFPPSVTTREPREGEVDGQQYRFITDDEFERLRTEGELLEWAIIHATKKYATLRGPILDAVAAGQTVIREVDIQGLISIRERLPRDIFTSIFVAPPDIETLRARILRRQPDMSDDELSRRLASAEAELAQRHLADREVVSREGEIEKLYDEVTGIIKAEV